MSCGSCGGSPVDIAKAAMNARAVVQDLEPSEASDEATVEDRAALCRACPSKQRKYGIDWCGQPLKRSGDTCGCIVWAKIRVSSQSCPQGKW